MQRLYRYRARSWRRMATIKRADAEAIQIKGPQEEDTDQGPAEGGDAR